jgi:lipoprotein signal peptidase
MISRDTWYIFIIALVMVILVYYVAATQEAKAFASAAVQLIYAGGGRNAQGNYPNYPR